MPIEFRCTQCNKLLRTPDETAGKQARCPECGAILTVPSPAAGPSTPPSPAAGPSTPPSPGESPFGSQPPPPPPGTDDVENPYRSPADYTTGGGPEAGQPAGAITPVAIDIGDVFSRTWEIFKDQWGMCLVALIVVWVLNFVVQMGIGILTGLVGAMAGEPAVSIVFSLLGNIASSLFSVWIGIGQALLFLKIARGQDATLGDIFSGGPYFLNILLASILVGLICFVGFLACIVPGIILALMFSQFYYLILDRNLGVLDSLNVSKEIMTGNKMMLFLIGLAAFGLMLVALIPCGLGLLVAVPYFALMYPVIYLTMTGQPTADQFRPAPPMA